MLIYGLNSFQRHREESHIRMQNSLNGCFNLALGIFEESKDANLLNEMKIFEVKVH
jgi:1,2-phenylacetyl-CoA epoxidase catalytic subunit